MLCPDHKMDEVACQARTFVQPWNAYSLMSWCWSQPDCVQGSVSALCCLQPCHDFSMPLLVSGSSDRRIHIWDPKKGNPAEPPVLIQTIHRHDGTVTALTAMENQLISGSTDRTIRVWRSAEGRCIMLYPLYEQVQVLRTMPAWVTNISDAPVTYQHDVDNSIFACDSAANIVRIHAAISGRRGGAGSRCASASFCFRVLTFWSSNQPTLQEHSAARKAIPACTRIQVVLSQDKRSNPALAR
jgi:WD40 repeat protein